MATLSPHRFTSREYYRMAETGVLKPGARVELLDGQIYNMSPIGPSHSSAVMRLIEVFVLLAQGRWTVCSQDAVALDDYSQPQPDLMLLRRDPNNYKKGKPLPEDVYLLIEVADSSLDSDREDKLLRYGRSGICEVWIVNIPDETFEIYRKPHSGGYAATEVLPLGRQASPSAFPDVVIDIATVLRPQLS